MLNLTIEEIHGYEEHGVDKLGNRVIKVSSVPVTLVHADLIVLGQNLQIGPATIRGCTLRDALKQVAQWIDEAEAGAAAGIYQPPPSSG